MSTNTRSSAPIVALARVHVNDMSAADLTGEQDADAEQSQQASEARATLLGLAHKKTGTIPAALVVAHVQAIAGASWELQLGALEALLKRIAAVKKERLRPSTGRRATVLGIYSIARNGAQRPYETLITGLDPLAASCSCADYRRSSLGLCKHALAAFTSIFSRPRNMSTAHREQVQAPTLRWDPIRPLGGAGAAIDRMTLQDGRVDLRLGAVHRAFRHGRCVLAKTMDITERLRALHALRRFTAPAGGWERAEPAVREVLADEIARVERAIEGRELWRKARVHLRLLKRPLYPYQREGVERFIHAGRLVLADDMGLGKTAQAIAAAHTLLAARAVSRVLIVVPASLKSQWQREWQEFTDAGVTVVDGRADERAAIYDSTRRGALIVNYEQVVRDLASVRAWAPQLVVLDEAQRIKNWQTKTAASVKLLSPRWRLVLSGTPLENRVDELASLLDWIDDTALAPSWRLSAWHLVRQDGQREIAGMRDIASLRERIAPHVLRRLRKDHLHQLPSRTDTRVPVELTAEQLAEHDELNLPIARLVAQSKRRPLLQAEFLQLMALLAKQRMICNGIALARYDEAWPYIAAHGPATPASLARLGAPKLGELVEIVQRIAIEQQRKIVIFSQWRRMLELVHWAIGPRLSSTGLKTVFFSGAESLARRTANVVAFHDDDATRVMLATDAGGVGLNLQRAASCVVNVEVPWNPAVLEQRVGRVHRHGQRHPVDVYNLVSVGGIESRIVDIVGDKRALFRGLFDGDSDAVTFERASSFLASLERVVEQPTVDDPDPLRLPDIALDEADDDDAVALETASNDEGVVYSNDDVSEPSEVVAEATPEPAVLAEPRGGQARADEDDTGASARSAAVASAGASTPPSLTSAVPIVMSALARIEVRRTAEGDLTITAPAEIAPTLGALLTTFGKLLASA